MRGENYTAVQVYRGDGTTVKQLKSLRKGDVFIVEQRQNTEHLIRKHDLDRGIIVLGRARNGIDDSFLIERFRGMRREAWIEVDHHTAVYLSRRLVEAIDQQNNYTMEVTNAAAAQSSER